MLKPSVRMIGQRKPNRNLSVFVASAFSVIPVMTLTGCGGGGGVSHTYAVGGTVSGLTSPGLAISLNGSPNMPVASGATVVALTPALASGSSYNVTISTQPVGESCAVMGGVGTIGTQNITTVKVVCSKLAYSLGGTIGGLSTNGLVLSNQGDTLTVAPGATTFAMPRKVTFASNYDVEVKAHPPGVQCSLADNSGLMPASPLTNINISCQQVEIVLHSFAGGTDGASPRGSLLQAPDGNLYGTTSAGGSSGLGTVFKITPAGQESVLYSFVGGSDGATPSGSLILASDGNLYGTTGSGGSGSGTVFKITLTGTEGVLYAFSGGADGQFPSGGLIQANDGQLYGTTAVGGLANAGTVFVVNLSGSEKVLYSFSGAPDGYEPFGSLIQATDGDLYGLALGGCKGYGCVFRVTLAGAETILHSFVQGIDGAGPFGSLIQASDGNLYGMTSGGGVAAGVNPPGTVFRISLDGIESTVHNFLGGSDGTYPEGSLIQASDGNLYGLTSGGGSSAINVGVAFKISLSGSETILYSFAGGIDAAAPRRDLVQGTDGHFYGTSLTGGTNGFGTVFRIN
jgi:uncharacterized repeat protein (TIGR03803 family)